MRFFAVITLCLLASAQTPPKAAFENDQVVVDDPHPGIEVPGFPKKMHDHKLNRVMIYMHPGGENLFYKDGSKTVLKWREGEVVWSPASGLHYSQIPPENPTFPGHMIVDIGVKGPGSAAKLHALNPAFQVELENPQVRVSRIRLAPHASGPMQEFKLNRLVVYMADTEAREAFPDGKTENISHKATEFDWRRPSKQKIENLTDKPFEAVIVEFKS